MVKAKAVRKPRKSKLDLKSKIRATEKAVKGKLLFENRALACHGKTVQEALRLTVDGARYRMADLRYDLRAGRLELTKSPGPKPKSTREQAPKQDQLMPKACLEEFFQFLSCQLQIEGRELLGQELPSHAKELFPEVDEHVKPLLGNTERWVPYHTVLGVHELFLMEAVHSRSDWSEQQRFVAIFVFRAHCKRDLFMKAQLPLMNKAFWKDPAKAFQPNGPMERAILAYRKRTGKALLTNCFRIIPPRVLKDNDANLARSIVDRSKRLVLLAQKAFRVVKDKSLTALQKLSMISEMIQETEGCGDTWAKMLTVCIDLAYPEQKILDADCDVGIGAAPPLQCLLGRPLEDRRKALRELLAKVNAANSAPAKRFWQHLEQVERAVRAKFKHLPLVAQQAKTKPQQMSAATLQVQLCEYRQFRHSWARNAFGLPDDHSMRLEEAEKEVFWSEKGLVCCEFGHGGSPKRLSVSLGSFGSRKVAERVCQMMVQKVRAGATEGEAERFREELRRGYRHGKDVKDNSEAWHVCKVQLSVASPLVSFTVRKDGVSIPFQTTVKAAGHILEAERIARLCWEKLQRDSKEDVVKYRNELYAMPGKRKR